MTVEACKICDNQCGYCKYACNCTTLVEVEDGTKRPRPEIIKEAKELFEKKPIGYEMKPELEIYTEGFEDGYKTATEIFNRQGLALQSIRSFEKCLTTTKS